MGVLRREKRLLSVSLHSVKGHSFSFLPTALALTSVTMRRLAHLLLLLELIVLSGTNCSKLETLHTVLLLLTCFAAFSAQFAFIRIVDAYWILNCLPPPLWLFLNFLLTCCNWSEFKLPKNGMRCIIQGPLKKWTEHSQELHLLKIHSRGEAPITPWGVIDFLDHELL